MRHADARFMGFFKDYLLQIADLSSAASKFLKYTPISKYSNEYKFFYFLPPNYPLIIFLQLF